MIKLTHGNLLEADVEALVNTVNTEGAMGKGIAAQFKRAFPKMFERYVADCTAGRVHLGKMHVVDLGGLAGGPRWIINFPTKGHWRARSRLSDITAGLDDLARLIGELNIRSIAVPPLGCGHGGLNWESVRPRIEEALGTVPNTLVLLYPPNGAPDPAEMTTRTERPSLTVGRAALIALIARYQQILMDPFVRLLEVHKLMYFLQEAGEPLRLEYSAQPYGPYASNLRHVLARLEGHWITGYGDGQDNPKKELDLLTGAEQEAALFLSHYPDVQERMTRVVKLIEGYEDPYGVELLSTVHWVMCNDRAARDSAADAVKAVRSWSPRKAELMKPEQIERAWKRLKELRWDSESRSAIH